MYVCLCVCVYIYIYIITIFKNDSANKMMDIVNTDRFSIVAQKIVHVSASNATSNAIHFVGVPVNVIHADCD
jgi:hypothetical protein